MKTRIITYDTESTVGKEKVPNCGYTYSVGKPFHPAVTVLKIFVHFNTRERHGGRREPPQPPPPPHTIEISNFIPF